MQISRIPGTPTRKFRWASVSPTVFDKSSLTSWQYWGLEMIKISIHFHLFFSSTAEGRIIGGRHRRGPSAQLQRRSIIVPVSRAAITRSADRHDNTSPLSLSARHPSISPANYLYHILSLVFYHFCIQISRIPGTFTRKFGWASVSPTVFNKSSLTS